MHSYKDVGKLVRLQYRIGAKVLETLKPLKSTPRRIVGLDAAYSKRYGGVAVAALTSDKGDLVSYTAAIGEPPLEYIPGLLAFREAPLLYAALQTLRENYDAIVVDGHGLSHPRYAGIASHIGLALGKPSIGVAKKKLYGKIEIVDKTCLNNICIEGYVVDNKSGMRLAAIVRPQHRKTRLYISPGAYITLEDAIRIIDAITEPEASLPAPTLHADRLSKNIARQLDRGQILPKHVKEGRIASLDKFLGLHKSSQESRTNSR